MFQNHFQRAMIVSAWLQCSITQNIISVWDIYLLSGLTILEVVLKVIFPALNSTRAWKGMWHAPPKHACEWICPTGIAHCYKRYIMFQDHLALSGSCIVAKERSPNSHDQLLSAGKRHLVSPKHPNTCIQLNALHLRGGCILTGGESLWKRWKRGAGREFCTITPKAQQVTSWDADWMPRARHLGHTLIWCMLALVEKGEEGLLRPIKICLYAFSK